MSLFPLLFILYLSFRLIHAELDFDVNQDDDLYSFITMPNTRAIKFNVTHHDRDRVSPGYWFVAPYWYFEADPPNKKYIPCQVGPHIYDENGTLIWTGSCLHHNRNIFDFKPNNRMGDGGTHLSFILQHSFADDGSIPSKGVAYILNDRYEVEREVLVTNDLQHFDLHEFNILDGGETALAVSLRIEDMTLADLGRPTESSRVASGGFVEINTTNGQVLFDWDSRGRIPLHESDHVTPSSPPEGGGGMDYIHVNAADKNANGDYLMSARYTSTIYLISGKDGGILWRLGGKHSDFAMDFTFSKQHNARFVSMNKTHTVISFLNNASDDFTNQENVSSALIVQLNTVNKTATVLNRYPRPDGGLSRMRGNFQLLPSGNVFVGWSEQGYHSEHAADGTVLMEAKFASPRFNSYRSYKLPFRGLPQQPPALVASVYASNAYRARPASPPSDPSAFNTSIVRPEFTTISHVSWNGATEVSLWNFYAQANDTSAPVLIGSVSKTDFETMFAIPAYMDWVSAEAVDREGHSLGWSSVIRSQMKAGAEEKNLFQPDDPSLLISAADKEYTKDGPVPRVFKIGDVVFGLILLTCVGALVVAFLIRKGALRKYAYSKVAS